MIEWVQPITARCCFLIPLENIRKPYIPGKHYLKTSENLIPLGYRKAALGYDELKWYHSQTSYYIDLIPSQTSRSDQLFIIVCLKGGTFLFLCVWGIPLFWLLYNLQGCALLHSKMDNMIWFSIVSSPIEGFRVPVA